MIKAILLFFWRIIKSIFFFFLFVFLTFVVLGVIIQLLSGTETTKVSDKSVLVIDLSGKYHDRSHENPLAGFNTPWTGRSDIHGLYEQMQALKAAATDDRIKGVVLKLESPEAGWAMMNELRRELIDFKNLSGKFVYGYGISISEKSLFVAGAADSVFLNPAGDLEYNGLSSEMMYFKGLLEKLEVKMEVFKAGDFKSAVESFTGTKMSPENREQMTAIQNDINEVLTNAVADRTGIRKEKLVQIADSMLIRNAKGALSMGMVNELTYADQFENKIRLLLEIPERETVNFIGAEQYFQTLSTGAKDVSGDKIALLFAEGDISGTSSSSSNDPEIAADAFIKSLRELKDDESVKAIVLRINSPGGSALASDLMWREIMLVREIKPVIASMSDVAASGGYYMAMACDSIVADSLTITGSIGVFGLFFTLDELMKNKLGITTDRVATGKFSDIGSVFRPLSSYERAAIQQQVDEIYDDFVSKAALGRRMKKEEMLKVASGRVWTGTAAFGNGLADAPGGINRAVEMAAQLSGTVSYDVVAYPEQKPFLQWLVQQIGGGSKNANLPAEWSHYAEMLMQLEKKKGVNARLEWYPVIN